MNGGILGMLAPQSHAASNGGLLGQIQQAWQPVWRDQGIGQGAGASPFTTQQLMGALGHPGSPVYGSYKPIVDQQNAGAGTPEAPPPSTPAPAPTADAAQMERIASMYGGYITPGMLFKDLPKGAALEPYYPQLRQYAYGFPSTSISVGTGGPFGMQR